MPTWQMELRFCHFLKNLSITDYKVIYRILVGKIIFVGISGVIGYHAQLIRTL